MEKPVIAVVTFPISDAGVIPLSNLVDIIKNLASGLYLITGNAGYDAFKSSNEINVRGIRHNSGLNTFTRITRYLITQFRISYEIARISPKVDFLIFFIGGASLLPSMLVAKVLNKKVILALSGSDIQSIRVENRFLSIPIYFMVRLNLILSNKIVVYGRNVIREYGLQKYQSKIFMAHKHFLDFTKFKEYKPLERRQNIIGYIGRLAEEKGILNFMQAVAEVAETREEATFLIGGDGQLRDQVEENANKLSNKAKFVGWIPHDELPIYLNELRLLVLPSYTEGLPNTMLEAMACGTPVLVTSVGAIPDFIKDETTGFVMENNSPECIARNILRALDHPNLVQISHNACALVKNEFTYEKAIEMFGTLLNSV